MDKREVRAEAKAAGTYSNDLDEPPDLAGAEQARVKLLGSSGERV